MRQDYGLHERFLSDIFMCSTKIAYKNLFKKCTHLFAKILIFVKIFAKTTNFGKDVVKT